MKTFAKILFQYSCTAVILGVASPLPCVQAVPVQARTANEFIDSIGVNTHLSRTASPGQTSVPTPYFINWKPKENSSNSLFFLLKKLGIKYIRSDITVSNDPKFTRSLIEAHKLGGIKSTLLVDTRTTGNLKSSLDATRINTVLDVFVNSKQDVNGDGIPDSLKDAIEAIEGPNEYDLNNLGNNGQGSTDPQYWASDLRDYQRTLFNTIRNNATYSSLAPKILVAPAGGWVPQIVEQESIASIKSYFDKGNFHPYPGPGSLELPSTASNLLGYTADARQVWNTKELWQSETGYTAALYAPDGHGVSEKAQGKYIPRLLAYSFGYQGIRRTYLYQLCDEYFNTAKDNKENHWGLIGLANTSVPTNGSAWTLRTKPAYKAIQNLIAILKDSPTKFTPTSLDFSLRNYSDSQGSVHSLLLQKSNGNFMLLLWYETSSFDTQTKRDLDRRKTISLTFNNTSIGSVRSVVPGIGTTWTNIGVNQNTVDLTVPDELMILDINSVSQSNARSKKLNKQKKATPQHGTNSGKTRLNKLKKR